MVRFLTLLLVVIFIFILAFGLIFGCTANEEPTEEAGKISVVASIYPVYSMVRALGGEKVSASCLLPPGASPHTYEPTTEQIKQAAGARLFLYIGADLDLWAAGLLTDSGPGLLVLDLSQETPLRRHEEDEEENQADDHAHGAADPHYWLDPVLVKDYLAPAITKALVSVSPGDEDYFKERLAFYQAELAKLNQEIEDVLGAFPNKKYVAFHGAWEYFAARYDLEQVAVITLFPGQEPSAGWMAELVKIIEREGVKAVFAEPQLSSALAEQIAEESNIKVLLLDPLGGEGLIERDNYLSLMRYNLQVFKEGFAGGLNGE